MGKMEEIELTGGRRTKSLQRIPDKFVKTANLGDWEKDLKDMNCVHIF